LSLCKQFLVKSFVQVINNKNKNSKRSSNLATTHKIVKRRDREGQVCIRIAFS